MVVLMKPCRVFCLLAALLMLLAAFSAAAEGADLTALSDSELVALSARVNGEFARRGLPKTATLPKGAYTAGKELPSGSYIYTCLATGNDWGNVTVYADGGKGDQLLWNIVSAPDEGEEPETIIEVVIPAGEKVVAAETPTREPYHFEGWFEENAAAAFDFENTAITADLTLKAKWHGDILRKRSADCRSYSCQCNRRRQLYPRSQNHSFGTDGFGLYVPWVVCAERR